MWDNTNINYKNEEDDKIAFIESSRIMKKLKNHTHHANSREWDNR